MQACSLGGGRIMINRLDGLDVNCSCEIPTLIVHNLDQPYHVAEVTSMLAHKSVNIANMSLYRDKRGGSYRHGRGDGSAASQRVAGMAGAS